MNAGVVFCLLITFPVGRVFPIWLKVASAKSGPATLVQDLQMLAAENLFITARLTDQLAFPCGQIPDLLMTTMFMLSAMASNEAVCASPLWGHRMVTMKPVFLAAAETASVWFTDLAGPLWGGHAVSPALSCPAALGVWQVTGWLVACLMGLVSEVLLRRAFLRTPEAQSFLGPAYAAAALKWPFGSSQKCQRCLTGVLALCYLSGLLWNTVRPFLG